MTTSAPHRVSTPRWIAIGLAALIMMGEVDRLVAEFLGADGESFQIADVTGITVFGNIRAWEVWYSSAQTPGLLILIHVALDVTFMFAYVKLLRRFDHSRLWHGAVWVLLAIDIIEDAMLATGAAYVTWGSQGLLFSPHVQAAVSFVKILMIAVLIGWAIKEHGPVISSRITQAYHLVSVHRVAAIVVTVLAIVSLIPRSGVLEQLPDIQRDWIQWRPSKDEVWVDPMPIVGAFFLTVLLMLVLFLIGRMRSELFIRIQRLRKLWQKGHPGQTPPIDVRDAPTLAGHPEVYLVWAAAPVALLIGFGAALALGVRTGNPWEFIDLPTFPIVFLILIAFPVVSLVFRNFPAGNTMRRPFTASEATKVVALGDAIAWVALTVIGLGMIRSFAAPAVLGLVPNLGESVAGLGVVAALSATFLAVGILVVLFGEWTAKAIGERIRERYRASAGKPRMVDKLVRRLAGAVDPDVAPRTWEFGARYVAVALALIALLALVIAPLPITALMGAIWTAVVVLLMWGILLATSETVMQSTRPIWVVGALGLRSAPILTLIVLVPFVLTQAFDVPLVHAIQSGNRTVSQQPAPQLQAGEPAERPTLADAFDEWVDGPLCVVGMGATRYRPMILVAAQGGGIRAATWTVDVMRKFVENDDCARDAVLMSSGASGGSVGLTMFRHLDTSRPLDTTEIGGEEPLSAGLAGTLVTDPIATGTGIRLPSWPGYFQDDGDTTSLVWQDRAALIQGAWAYRAEQLASDYDFSRQSPTGYLLLNSTAAGSGCRAVISQIDLEIGVPPKHPINNSIRAGCTSDTPPVSAMIDVQDYCNLDIDWATAAMFSARFPVVTPAARIIATPGAEDECAALAEMQLADGGYSENSGLGTLSDLAPELVQLVHRENAKPGDAVPIVPLLLYIRNEAGADVNAAATDAAPELLVPLLANSTKEALISDGAWLQRLSDTLPNVCRRYDNPCNAAVEAAWKDVAGGIAVAAPSTRPAITSPLGWTLSKMSRVFLDAESDAQMRPTCKGDRDTSYGTLGDLMNTISLTPYRCWQARSGVPYGEQPEIHPLRAWAPRTLPGQALP